MVEVVIEQAVHVVAALLLMLIGVLGTWLTSLIAKRQEQMGKQHELENIALAMNELISMTQQTVGELEQTMVESMKAATEDGKLTEQDIISLGIMLYNITCKKLSDPAKNLLVAAGVDLQAFITSAGEDWINSIRNRTVTVVEDPPVSTSAIGFETYPAVEEDDE